MLRNLAINRIVMHEIFKKGIDETAEPFYGEHLLNLEDRPKASLAKRIIDVLGANSHSIEMMINDIGNESVYAKVSSLIHNANDEEYIEQSKQIALKLSRAQTTTKIPGGVVFIINGTAGESNHPFIVIIKAEMQEGFAKTKNANTMGLNFIENLVLTPQQRLYKIGLFLKTGNNQNKDDYYVKVYDYNMTAGETKQAAHYFYSSFLGCIFTPSDKKLTKDFFDYSKEFINTNPNFTDEEKYDLHQSLYSYLKVNNSEVIEISTFAEDFITEPNQRDNYRRFMVSKNIPERAISKDLEFIKYKLRNRTITFSSKVKVYEPVNDNNQLCEIIERQDDSTILKIKGFIESQN